MSEEQIQIGSRLHDAADPEGTSAQHIQIGSRLRDAAVDPRPEDYQAPVRGSDGKPVSVQALSPRSGNPPYVNGASYGAPAAD